MDTETRTTPVGPTCGCHPAAAAATSRPDGPAATPCCGTARSAADAGACCDPTARTAAVSAGASCC
jgi:hypothetical protein